MTASRPRAAPTRETKMNRTIHVDRNTLVQIYTELDRAPREMPFETAAELGLCFAGGFDHAEIQANGWTLKLHDRGMNDRCRDFVFSVPVADRDSRRGPLFELGRRASTT